MFTGIIEAIGSIERISSVQGGRQVSIASHGLGMGDVQLGDSIAVNGVCLTVTRFSECNFTADISAESLRHTRFADMKAGDPVNLEKALTLSTRLGGHLVSGHVDGIGTLLSVSPEGASLRYTVQCPKDIMRYIANKGSITVDGVSLTVTGLEPDAFYLNIVPHTAENTIIPGYKAGSKVHLEVDLMARYAERLLSFASQEVSNSSPLDRAFLARHGYKSY